MKKGRHLKFWELGTSLAGCFLSLVPGYQASSITFRASPHSLLFYSPVSQDRHLFSLAKRFENQFFTAAMSAEDYKNRIHKELSKFLKVRLQDFPFFDERGWRRFTAEAS